MVLNIFFQNGFFKMILKIAIGRRKDNPSLRDVGYNDNTIKSQFPVRPIACNVQSSIGKFNDIDDTPLPKRRK